MNPVRSFVAMSITAVISTQAAHAAVIAEYRFNSDSTILNVASSDGDAFSNASNISFGAKATAERSTTDLKTVNEASYMTVKATQATTSLSGAVNNGVSFSFTITPAQGVEIDFDSLTGLVRRSAQSSQRGWLLRSSLTGSTDLAQDADVSAFRANAMETLTPSGGSLDLSGVSQLQNVAAPVTFTIFVNPGADSANLGRSVDFDNIVLAASVPEPACIGLLSLGMLVLGRRHRA